MHEEKAQQTHEDGGKWTHAPSRRLLLKEAVGVSLTLGLGLMESARADQKKGGEPPFDADEAKKFMSRALELARQGVDTDAGGPFAAVLVRDGNIIGEAWNRVIADTDPTAHGEVMAIRDACKKTNSISLKGCDLYTVGEPCPMCLSASYWAHVSRIFYGFSVKDATAMDFQDEFQYNEFAKPIARRKVPEIQFMAKEAVQLTKDFMARPNHVRY